MIETTEMHTKRENLSKFVFVSFFVKSILTGFGLMASTHMQMIKCVINSCWELKPLSIWSASCRPKYTEFLLNFKMKTKIVLESATQRLNRYFSIHVFDCLDEPRSNNFQLIHSEKYQMVLHFVVSIGYSIIRISYSMFFLVIRIIDHTKDRIGNGFYRHICIETCCSSGQWLLLQSTEREKAATDVFGTFSAQFIRQKQS